MNYLAGEIQSNTSCFLVAGFTAQIYSLACWEDKLVPQRLSWPKLGLRIWLLAQLMGWWPTSICICQLQLICPYVKGYTKAFVLASWEERWSEVGEWTGECNIYSLLGSMSDFWILTVKDVELGKTWEELFSQKTETLGWGRLLWGPGAQGRGRRRLSQLFNREMVTSQDCRQHLHRNCGGAGRGLPQMAWELWAWIKVLRQKNHWVRSWAHFLGLSEHLERLYKKLEFCVSS